jgi:phage terminase large subunit-like protein
MERSELVRLHGEARRTMLAKLRNAIIHQHRLDLLCKYILGLKVTPFHFMVAQFTMASRNALVIAPRGSGKSTFCVEGHALRQMAVDPNVRLCFGSRTKPQAIKRLRTVRTHLESNSMYIETFGEKADPRGIWNATEIQIKGRTIVDSTPTVMCVGAKGSIAGAHFDGQYDDDMVDKTNSSTPTTRQEYNEWYTGTYLPMFDPPDPDVPLRGWKTRVGTRYNILDAYGNDIKLAQEMKRRGLASMDTLVVPALAPNAKGVIGSYWPERWPVSELMRRQVELGSIQFGLQYQGDAAAMNGDLFRYSDFIEVHEDDVPKDLEIFMGVDLAVSEDSRADYFAIVIVGASGSGAERDYYILDYMKDRIPSMPDQVATIGRWAAKWKPLKIGIDAQGYQLATVREAKRKLPSRRIIPIKGGGIGHSKHDGAVSLQPVIEAQRVHLPCAEDIMATAETGELVLKEPHCWPVRENIVLFPNDEHDDLFDAFRYAMAVGGVIGAATTNVKETRPRHLLI